MRTFFTVFLAAGFSVLSAACAGASPEPKNPKHQTPWHLYVDAKEALEMKKTNGDKVLFVDVRDPIEIMFTGYTDVVDVNIPYRIVDMESWSPKKPAYKMNPNPDFEDDIRAALRKRGMSKKDAIILMCRSGTRQAKAAKKLGPSYKKIYMLVNGFEGGKVKDSERKHWRLKNGWKNSGLPWSYKLNRDKMYFKW